MSWSDRATCSPGTQFKSRVALFKFLLYHCTDERNRKALAMTDAVKEKRVLVSLGEDNNPIFQEIARFRAILFDNLLKSHGITMAQGWALVILSRENGLSQSELADRLEIATVTTSKLIDRLVARGWVERRPKPGDRRSNLVFATPAAESVVKVMSQTIIQVDQAANEGLTQTELDVTRAALVKMHENLKTALDKQ